MKLTTSTAAIILLALTQVQAAPAAYDTALTKRETSLVQATIDDLQSLVEKRDTMTLEELSKRESQIVTDVLTAIKNTGLAPGILEYFISDPQLKPIVIDVIVYALKSGLVNLDTLLKALNDSGLAVDVIQSLISDCAFYAEIYKLALSFIPDLLKKLGQLLTGSSKRDINDVLAMDALQHKMEKRNSMSAVQEYRMKRADTSSASSSSDNILTSLMESLKNSGLADQVVRALVVDPDFYSFGGDLISELLKENAISFPELLSAIVDSGLVPSLIKAFLNIKTFQTVITNALAAAFGKCDGSSVTATVTGTATTSATGGPISSANTAAPTGVCRKKKRSYNY